MEEVTLLVEEEREGEFVKIGARWKILSEIEVEIMVFCTG